MKKICILLLVVGLIGCTAKERPVVINKPNKPVVVVNTPSKVENTVIAPNPAEVNNNVSVVEENNTVVSVGCTCGKSCKCANGKPCGGECDDCKECKCKAFPDDIDVVVTPPPVKKDPGVPAGYVRTYFWKNGVKWYQDTPVATQKAATTTTYTSGGCPTGGCPTTVKKNSVSSVNTAGMHSHKCGSCGNVFWHVDGSHMCPKCGKGPWYVIQSGTSKNSGGGRAILPWRR